MQIGTSRPTPRLLAVRAPEEIEFLVKESEVLTGRSGRVFVIASADRLTYRIQWQVTGCRIERLDANGRAVSVQHLASWELVDHSLVEASLAGQLFTPHLPPSAAPWGSA